VTSAIIVDDEQNLIELLQTKLAELWPELEILGSAVNGRQAIALAKETQPDIAFLDIHMPGLSGLQVAEALPASTQLVFVTAFDEFAVDAFERAAIDYLLKPVSDARLQQTIARLQNQHQPSRDQLVATLRELQPPLSQHLQWIRAGLDDTTQLISVDEVIYFQADKKYTSAMTQSSEHILRRSIKELEQQLDRNKFWRVNRGVIVQVAQIVTAKRDLRGRYTLTLRDRNETLRASQPYGHLFKHM
jgi:DNA-binding LytR/AlgR family response regulator